MPGDFAVSPDGAQGLRIGIVGLNTAFLQLAGGDYRGHLVWDVKQIGALFPQGVDRWLAEHDYCLVLTHHGPDWLTPEARRHGEREVAPATHFVVHLFGHMHETDIDYSRRGGSQTATRLLQGCSLFGMEKHGDPPTIERAHGYCAGRIDLDADGASLRLWPRIATDESGPWRYIPDHHHAVLQDDDGTEGERLPAPQERTRPNQNESISTGGKAAQPVEQDAPLAGWERLDVTAVDQLEPLTDGDIDERVLADLVGVPRRQVYTRVVNRLGAESTAVRSAGHVLTRHEDVARAIVMEAQLTLGIDLGEVWAAIIEQTVATGQTVSDVRGFSQIVHLGPRLANAPPKQFSAETRHDIAIVAARAAVEHKADWLGCIVDLGKTHRNAGDADSAADVFRNHLADAKDKVDYSRVIRGYWFEWGVCEGRRGVERTHALDSAWLCGLSLSDHLNPAPVTLENIKLSCAGLGVAFGNLAGTDGGSVHARARRAAAWLGERTNPDDKARSYFKDHNSQADAIGTPSPSEFEQAIDWMQEGVRAAGQDLPDAFLRELASPDSIRFEQLAAKLRDR